jgi:TonB family protein
MTDNLQLVLVHSGKGPAEYVTTKIAVNDTPPIERIALAFTSSKAPLRVTLVDLKRAEVEPLATQGRLSVAVGKAERVDLAVSRFDIALRGLEACERDLLKHWGMTEAAQAAIAAKPLPLQNMAAYISNADYPMQAVRNGEQGTSGVRFWVGQDGKPRDCEVVETSSSTLLDQTTCRIVTARARFSPALDREGKAVPSLSFTRIRWVLPDG